MNRRNFMKFTAATASAIAAQGGLPLLAAGKKKAAAAGPSKNCFTEPCAIEPITGFLPTFTPVQPGTMKNAFSARYTLLYWQSADTVSRCAERGHLGVSWNPGLLNTSETRTNRPTNIVKASITCAGEWNTAASWKLNSSFEGRKELGFAETGTWDGKAIKIKGRSWTQEYATGNPLIARWALLPLLASGSIRSKPLTFDMLDDSTLRPNQTLRYEGEITIPVKGGKAKLLSYVQTGTGIVPTHYLVDSQGCVQLITMSMVNWALTDLKA